MISKVAGNSALVVAEDVHISRAPTELSDTDLTQCDALLQICDEAEVWLSPDGDVFASVPLNGHIEHYRIASREFQSWMLHQLASSFTRNGRPASANRNAVQEARAGLEARARNNGTTYPVSLRVAEQEQAIFVDLGTQDWSAIRVDAEGWAPVPTTPTPIVRGKRTAAFEEPARNADFAPLRNLLDHLDEDAFILVVAWCLGALLPSGPYPILILGGEAGSGKSTLTRLIRQLTDPTLGDILQPPREERDLIAAAKANRVLSFDNLSGIKPDLADSLCRLATGSEIGGRALYTDHDSASFAACRPILINGIPDLAARGDLADRSIVLRLPVRPVRKTEKEWKEAVEKVLAPTFAGLLDALSLGLGSLAATPSPDVRMADFACFIMAAEPVLPWGSGECLAAYERNREEVRGTLIEFDSVAMAIRDFVAGKALPWEGLKSELYTELSQSFGQKNIKPDDWPRNPRWFSDRLDRAKPLLRSVGIKVGERRTAKGKTVTLDTLAPPAPPSSTTATKSDQQLSGGRVVNVASDANCSMFTSRGVHPRNGRDPTGG